MNPLLPSLLLLLALNSLSPATVVADITRGFSGKPGSRPPAISQTLFFESLLNDLSGKFSFGFLTDESSQQLDLAVVHLPSAFPVWRANAAASAGRSASLTLSFDGHLIFSDREVPLWKAGSFDGAAISLLNSGNLQILDSGGSTVWQSFDFPSSTLVSGQTLRSSAALSSPDGRFSFRLGNNFMALHLNSDRGKTDDVIYWEKEALQANGTVVPGGGPIYATLNETGYLALFQNSTNRVHVESFYSANLNVSGLRRLTLEDDGNLRGYYWNEPAWNLDYRAITIPCELPDRCGAYGLCSQDETPAPCQCLNGAGADSCLPAGEGDLCGQVEYTVVRRKGVELAYSEYLGGAVQVESQEECEQGCERNCSCWGALYNTLTNRCYRMRFHVRTLVKTGDNRVGYFKVRVVRHGADNKTVVLACFLVLAAVVVLVAGALFWRRRNRRRRSAGGALVGEGISPGPYKEFHGSTSFRQVELSSSDK